MGGEDDRVVGARRQPVEQAGEIALLAPLVVITILLGIYPKPVLDVTTPAVAKLISDNKAALMIDHAHKVALVQKEAGK